MGNETDRNGNYHDENGRFVSLRDFIEMIFDEKEKAAAFERSTTKEAMQEAKSSTEKAMQEAKSTVDQRLIEAKTAADGVTGGITRRLDNLESGGAPFASRLDDGLKQLKADVDILKEGAIKQGTVDELRKQQTAAIDAQRKQLRAVFITAALALLVGLILAGVQLIQ